MIPAFTRTSAYYETKTKDPAYRFFEASDVRRQVAEAPSGDYYTEGAYPRPFSPPPSSGLRLRAQPPYREYPLIPSSSFAGGAGTGYRSDIHRPGPVRVFYNDDDRTRFDVGYQTTSRGEGRTRYNLAVYHPAPTFGYLRRL
ncbi:hypothetical protein F5Y17DRAFT_431456 [Xylariaceae sp. FL0594]|nr:hypothetical protein F5Y17DRAFT_431456 [Xylariaceae sp. FL0594]